MNAEEYRIRETLTAALEKLVDHLDGPGMNFKGQVRGAVLIVVEDGHIWPIIKWRAGTVDENRQEAMAALAQSYLGLEQAQGQPKQMTLPGALDPSKIGLAEAELAALQTSAEDALCTDTIDGLTGGTITTGSETIQRPC